MGKFARSARGSLVNFDELEIKHALKSVPAPVSVDTRRQFINDKDGISPKKAAKIAGETASGAMAMALQAAQESIEAVDLDEVEVVEQPSEE